MVVSSDKKNISPRDLGFVSIYYRVRYLGVWLQGSGQKFPMEGHETSRARLATLLQWSLQGNDTCEVLGDSAIFPIDRCPEVAFDRGREFFVSHFARKVLRDCSLGHCECNFTTDLRQSC